MCGPEGFMKAARAMASETAIAAQYEESFGEKIIVEEADGLCGEVYFSLSGEHGTARPRDLARSDVEHRRLDRQFLSARRLRKL